MNDQNKIEEFVRKYYGNYLKYFEDHIPIVEGQNPDDFHIMLVLKIMPSMHSLNSEFETHSLFREVLQVQFNENIYSQSMELRKVAYGFYELFFQKNRDLTSERLNLIYKVVGYVSLIFNLTYVFLLFLIPSGFSLGPIFALMCLAIWLTPSFVACHALQKSPTSFFFYRHKILLVINIVFACWFGYLTIDRLIQIFW